LEFNKYTLTIPGLRLASFIDKYKNSNTGLREDLNILEVLELDAKKLNIPTKDLVLYTIHATDFFRNELKFIGRNIDVDKIYIPLI